MYCFYLYCNFFMKCECKIAIVTISRGTSCCSWIDLVEIMSVFFLRVGHADISTLERQLCQKSHMTGAFVSFAAQQAQCTGDVTMWLLWVLAVLDTHRYQ